MCGDGTRQTDAAIYFPCDVSGLEIFACMLCKSCGDELEDTNRYACTMGAKVYMSNTCRPCKRTQAVRIYYLRKEHPRPPPGSPCECCGRIANLQLDHAHVGSRAYRGMLCKNCNIGIGHLGDSSEGVAKALAYLVAAKARESCSAQRENGLVAFERSDRVQ